jgi:hypothetical protein
MSLKIKGQLTVATEWAKHLKKFLRRQFWKGERKAVILKNDIDRQ